MSDPLTLDRVTLFAQMLLSLEPAPASPCGITTEMSRPASGWLRALTFPRAPERLEQRGHGVVRDELPAVGDLEVHGCASAAGARHAPRISELHRLAIHTNQWGRSSRRKPAVVHEGDVPAPLRRLARLHPRPPPQHPPDPPATATPSDD